MTIMAKENFEEYCSFMFSVLDAYESKVIETKYCINLYEEGCYSRVSGYLGEILTSTYIEYAISRGDKAKTLTSLKCYEL